MPTPSHGSSWNFFGNAVGIVAVVAAADPATASPASDRPSSEGGAAVVVAAAAGGGGGSVGRPLAARCLAASVLSSAERTIVEPMQLQQLCVLCCVCVDGSFLLACHCLVAAGDQPIGAYHTCACTYLFVIDAYRLETPPAALSLSRSFCLQLLQLLRVFRAWLIPQPCRAS